MLGYGIATYAYWVWSEGEAKLARPIKRLPVPQQWDLQGLQAVAQTRQTMHQPRAARAVPITASERDEGVDEQNVQRRAARSFEIRQLDVDPSLGGIGWTEGCNSCDRARRYGWGERKMNHSSACRRRVEEHLGGTADGRQRLDAATQRLDRWTAAEG